MDSSLGLELLYSQERNSCILVVIVLMIWTCLLVDDFALYASQAKLNDTQCKCTDHLLQLHENLASFDTKKWIIYYSMAFYLIIFRASMVCR